MEFVEKPTRKSFVDIEGMVFGELKIIGYLGPKGKQQRWLAECSCGNTVNVDGTSVRVNLTKSCGCLRKKNGGKIPLSKEEAEKLCVGFELIEYKGMKHPATFKCKDCGKFGETPLANNLRSYICECKGNTAQQKREDAFKDKGFQLLSTEGQIHTIMCMSCKTESYYSGALEYIDICKCKLDVSSDNPAAIYCLHNSTDNYIKVGKSIRPMKRLGDINSDRIENNMEPLYIYRIVWVVSESAAYYLESLYHRKHINRRLYLEDWTGSTETFGLKNKTANNTFLKLNKDVYAVLNKYGIRTDKTIELIRMFDNNNNN